MTAQPTAPVSTADLSFDLLEGLKRAWRSAGHERKADDIAAGFARGTGGIDVPWLIEKLGPPPPVPPVSSAAQMVREMRTSLSHWDYLLPGDYWKTIPAPMESRWPFGKRPVRITTALEIWAGEMARARSLMDLEAVANALEAAAIADTQPEAGDVKQAPLVSGGGAGTAIAQPSSGDFA